MSDQVVRGYWLTGGVKFFRSRYSPETNERLLGSLPKPLRAVLAEIQPVQWYTRAHHVDVLRAVVSVHRDEASAFESLLAYGQLVATDLAGGSLRPMMQILTPKLLAKRLPQMWASDHGDDGGLEVDIAQLDDSRLSVRLLGLGGYEHVGVVTLGWIKGFMVALGGRDVAVKQSGWGLTQTSPSEMSCEVSWS